MPFDGTNPPGTVYKSGENRNNPTNNPWRDEKNVWLTQSLFYEFAKQDKSKCLYTIYERDRIVKDKVYKSIKNIYLNYNHIPGHEYEFANEYFGGWEHWKKLQASAQNVRDVIKAWQDELEVKLKAQAVKGIISAALEGGNTGFQANKWLSDKGWIPQKGRPKKADIQREARIAAGVSKEIEEDLHRLKLVKK